MINIQNIGFDDNEFLLNVFFIQEIALLLYEEIEGILSAFPGILSKNISDFISQLHKLLGFFNSFLNIVIILQLFSHNDWLIKYSFLLSFKDISVPTSVVNKKHISLKNGSLILDKSISGYFEFIVFILSIKVSVFLLFILELSFL